MEEIVQALFEDGVLQRNGTVKLAKSMNAVKVPATVQAVLASRIDRLPVEEKELLQTPASGDVEYIFKHALTQEVAYNALLVERRKLLHERAGVALEAMFAEQLDDHLDELAHHYSRSDNAAKGVKYLGRAGQHALQRSTYTDAIRSLSAGLSLV